MISLNSKKVMYIIPAFLLVLVMSLALYGKIYSHVNKDVFYEVGGEFRGVYRLPGDLKKKRILELYIDGEPIKYTASLRSDEEHYLKSYKGEIIIKYQKSPFSRIWIREIRTQDKVFKRE